MTKKITLHYGKIARLDDYEPFILPDDLVLHFDANGYDISNAFITIGNGGQSEQIKLTQDLVIPRYLLHAGILSLDIVAYSGDKVINKWSCFPIRIIEADGEKTAYDVIYAMEKDIAELKAAVDELKPKNIFEIKEN